MMFGQLRSKIAAVKNNVTSGVKSVLQVGVEEDVKVKPNVGTLEEESFSDTRNRKADITQLEVSTDEYGLEDVLHRYELEWESIHNQSEQNASKAMKLTGSINHVQLRTESAAVALTRLDIECQSFSELLSGIQQITDKIADLHGNFAIIEDDLQCLENLCEEMDFFKAQQAERNKLEAYKKHKVKQLQQHNTLLANEHARKIKEAELRQLESTRQKQNFYQKAFEEDMRKYKAQLQLKNPSRGLSQITLTADEDEAQNLEDFLSSTKVENATERQTKHKDVSQPENSKMTEISASGSQQSAAGETDEQQEVTETERIQEVRETRSNSELSARQLVSSGDSLEWDDTGDDLNINANHSEDVAIDHMISSIENALK